jgi:squalene-hopene cyclase-like protein
MPSGGWRYPARRAGLRSADNYDQLETFRILSILVEKHGLDRSHPAIRRASRYVLAHQSVAGDIRGIYGNQYSPNYTAAFLELLTKAGLSSNPAVRRSFRWILSVRQDDGGWAIPFRTAGRNFDPSTLRAATIQPVTGKPSSHLVTGVVLRALAASRGLDRHDRRRHEVRPSACRCRATRFSTARSTFRSSRPSTSTSTTTRVNRPDPGSPLIAKEINGRAWRLAASSTFTSERGPHDTTTHSNNSAVSGRFARVSAHNLPHCLKTNSIS